jgi:two-component system, cell cycle sensor histidine kinase and response regulator CckA
MESLGTLAGGVAHDLNNVIGVTMAYSELLLETAAEGSHQRKYADNILSSTEKAAIIIQDLLTLARRGVSVSEVINLNDRVRSIIESPEYDRLRSYHSSVIFNTDLCADSLNINGSAVHIEKTVFNLISNAAEAISGGGEVTIRTESWYLDKPVHGYDVVREGDYAVITVSDTGAGINQDDIDKIFEPFYTKKKMGRSGTGLG